jgi:O-antigen ligase
MTRKQPNPNPSKSKALAYFEYVLLALCVAVIVLRTTITEGPVTHSTTFAINLGDSLYSLSISTVLMLAFALWIIWSILSRHFIYKLSGIEIGLGIFCIGAFVAVLAAADKRIAITDAAVFLAPAIMALLLVQILDSPSKVKLVLAIIAALGIVSAYQSADQYFVSNQMTIEQYEKDPQSMLGPLGIEAGSFKQFLFEHRLYSKGVRGFFTTRNSDGSFVLMTLFAAVALFINKLKNRRPDKSDLLYILGCGFGIAVILFNLGLTRSKGAVIGLFFAVAAFFVLLLFGNRLKAYRWAILAVCLLLVVVGICAVAWYGLNHGRLPGGGSMLVRWQYWHSAAKMYADHPLAGVGPGNFGDFYTHYKPAAALESVADPHDFLLSLLTQYGPLGLLGFLAMLFVPLWRLTAASSASPSLDLNPLKPTFRTQAIIFIIAGLIAFLLVRPILMPETFGNTIEVIIYVILTMHIAPTAVFIIAFVLLAGPLLRTRDSKSGMLNANVTVAVFCAVTGVAVHNLFDFAIFEPGVLTTFWIMIACLIAMNMHAKSQPLFVLKPRLYVKVLTVAAVLTASCIYFHYVFTQVAASTILIRQAKTAMPSYAHELLEEAAKVDVLSPSAFSLNGRLYLQEYEMSPNKNRDLLLHAESCLQIAIERNDAAYKNYERLTEVYNYLAERSTTEQEKAGWLKKAFQAASQAVEHYQGCGRLHFKLAQIADQMGKTKIAAEQYGKTVEIEDEYRSQFRQLYPERKNIVSRIDNKMYLDAKERIKELSAKSGN